MNATFQNVWIVVAAYNEGEVLADVLAPLLNAWPDVVVVDDGSKDCTADVALKAGAVVIRHPINLGQGAALKTGIDYALQRGAEYIITFDADGQHRVSDIDVLLAGLASAKADIATGSRFLGHAEGMRRSKRLVLKAAVFLRVSPRA
ncbi:glycosyltransferase family 2 protein [Achromobacter denitrificans]|uniref:Glycosyltransferase family 2 protein n=1 Tax=Achromobacter denitrificans TaxID=32002 RepID=A0ABZ3G1J9_ACHDE